MHTVRLTQAAIPHLERSGKGSIVAVSSVARGGSPAGFSGPYGTMKTAIVGYVSGLALECAGRGVRANVVSPGTTYFPDGLWQGIERGNPEPPPRPWEGTRPAGWAGRREMATAVVFLASPASSFTTGAHLVVDGAFTRGIQCDLVRSAQAPLGSTCRRSGRGLLRGSERPDKNLRLLHPGPGPQFDLRGSAPGPDRLRAASPKSSPPGFKAGSWRNVLDRPIGLGRLSRLVGEA